MYLVKYFEFALNVPEIKISLFLQGHKNFKVDFKPLVDICKKFI